MARQSVRGTPVRHVSPTGNEGFRQAGPDADSTVLPQYRGGGINTKPNERGTPTEYAHGNVDEFKRTVSHDARGRIADSQGIVHNDPASNGVGVVFDGANSYEGGFFPKAEPTMDSPVPLNAPVFEAPGVKAENRAHLGRGNENADAALVDVGGVMSRGMVGTSKPSEGEAKLTTDDTLPEVAPAASVNTHGSTYETVSKYSKR